MKLVIGIVLYHPDWDTLMPRLVTFCSNKVFIYDNSPQSAPKVIESQLQANSNVSYKWMQANFGICQPYRELIESDEEFDFVITLDQDSLADAVFINNLLDEWRILEEQNLADTVSVFAPFHQVFEDQVAPLQQFQPVMAIMSSGSLIRREALLEVGGFDERYWLDGFDHDYCIGLRLKNYQVIRANRVVLKHPLGELSQKKTWWNGEVKSFSQHPIWRLRLIARNRRLLWFKHWRDLKWILKERWQEVKDILKIILLEDQKFARLTSIALGVIDFYIGRRGAPRFIQGAQDRWSGIDRESVSSDG